MEKKIPSQKIISLNTIEMFMLNQYISKFLAAFYFPARQYKLKLESYWSAMWGKGLLVIGLQHKEKEKQLN